MKRLLCLFLAASALMLLMWACGGDEEEKTPAATPTTPAAETPAATVALKEATIKIGQIGTLSGPQAGIDPGMKIGMEMGIDKVNEDGGIVVGDTHYTFENMGSVDDRGDPAVLTAGVTEMVEDKHVQVLIGPLVGPILDLTQITFPEKVICFNARICGITVVTPPDDIVKCVQPGQPCRYTLALFSLYASSPATLQHILSIPPFNSVKSIAAFHPEPFRAYTEQVGRAVEAMGIKYEATYYTPGGAIDFSALLTRIKGSKPDLLFYAPAAPEEGALILKTAVDLNVAPMLYSWPGGSVTDALTFGPNGGPITQPWARVSAPRNLAGDDPAIVAYRKEYARRSGQSEEEVMGGSASVAAWGMFTYDGIRCLAQAIEKEQSVDPDKIVDTLVSPDFKCKDALTILGWSSIYHDLGTLYDDVVVINGQVKTYKYIIPALLEPGDPTLTHPEKPVWEPVR